MEINFGTLRIRNFLSAGQSGLTYHLNQYKSNLIVGNNGHGKSLMIDALCFVLFNRPFRKINKTQLVNSINQRGLLVEIDFTAGGTPFRVVRGMKPNIFEIYENGKLVDQDAAKGDYQTVLEREILRTSFKTFCQVVILGSATYTPFMQLPAGHRREVVEDLLNLEIYSVMLSLAKTQIDETKEEITQLTNSIAVIEAQRATIEKQLSQQDSVDQSIIVRLDEQISKVLDDLAEKQAELDGHVQQLTSLNQTYNKIPDVRPKINRLTSLVSAANDHIRDGQKHIKLLCEHDNCPLCEQPIDQQFKAESVTAKTESVAKYKGALVQIGEKMDYLQSVQSKKLETMEEINQVNQRVIMSKNMIDSADRHLASLRSARQSNFSITSGNAAENKKALKEVVKKIKSSQLQLRTVKETHTLLQFAQSIVRDGGIKAQIIKKYVPMINQLINEYLAAMDFFVTFELNEVFEETIKSRHRDEFSYNSFSEGEKVRINLAILFAWRAVAKIRNSTNISLLIFDEVFDGALDGFGTEDLTKLMTAVSETTSVWLISHTKEGMTDKFDNVIEIVKEKNFSTMRQIEEASKD